MVNLDVRLARLEERQVLEATQLIFACARAASLDDVARFVTAALEFEQKPEPDKAEERRLWGYLGIPLEALKLAENRPELWHEQLGDLLGARHGLRAYLCEHYPDAARQLYGQRGADREER